MKRFLFVSLFFCLSNHAFAQEIDGFTTDSEKTELQTEQQFLKNIDETAFKKHLKALTVKPHVSGNKANEDVRDYMASVMRNAGLEVDLYPYDIYMSNQPGTSMLEIVTPVRQPLSQQENIMEEDPFSSDSTLWKGWNAYSGSGDVTAEVVYANYGTKEDFKKLEALGVETKGKIILARYGGNFRGYKAKFAEASGAAGLIIYTDPKDSGFTRGLTFPEGAYYDETTIQRGSVLSIDYMGDPLTPFEPALPLDGKTKVKRMNPKDAGLHTIPVTPIGYASAQEILGRMKGAAVPVEWQGGLPFTYRVEGGKELTVHLKVDQPRDYVRINNVIGTLKGSEYPDEWIILGCHYDAWGFGATDPNSGTAMLLSLSESLGKLAKEGKRPKRSILIGHWDAEEHGVIGSSEWVEQMKTQLEAKAVAYLNFDAGVSGKKFGASAAPTLKRLILEASKQVQDPYENQTLFTKWSGEKSEPEIGNLGGGSDHIAFYMHTGVPSLSGGTSGPTLYHSNYDDFYYYENFVDPEFKMGPMVQRVVGIMSLRLANAEIIPYDVPRYATDLKQHFKNAEEKIAKYDTLFNGFVKAKGSIEKLEASSTQFAEKLKLVLSSNRLNSKTIQLLNKQLLALEKSFLEEKGMYFGSWYKSLYAASDPFSGYASWILPGLEYEIALGASDKLTEWDVRYSQAIERLNTKIEGMLKSL